jgi:hypothetical protein
MRRFRMATRVVSGMPLATGYLFTWGQFSEFDAKSGEARGVELFFLTWQVRKTCVDVSSSTPETFSKGVYGAVYK